MSTTSSDHGKSTITQKPCWQCEEVLYSQFLDSLSIKSLVHDGSLCNRVLDRHLQRRTILPQKSSENRLSPWIWKRANNLTQAWKIGLVSMYMWGFRITHCPRHLHKVVLAIDFFCLNSKLGSSRLTHFQLDSKQLDHKDSHRSLQHMLLAFSGDILLVLMPNPKCRWQDRQEARYTGS